MAGFYERLVAETETERSDLISIPIIQQALRGEVDKSQYIDFLKQAYHHVKHTVPLLMACGSRMDGNHMWLQPAIAEYIEEEIGHDEWILNDLKACGADAESIRHSQPGFETEMMVSYAYHQIDRGNPISFFGMVLVLEGTSIALATHAASAIQLSLGLPDHAFTYLNSHGSLDQGHVKFFQNLMNQVNHEADQQSILHSARCFFRLYGDIFLSLQPAVAVKH